MSGNALAPGHGIGGHGDRCDWLRRWDLRRRRIPCLDEEDQHRRRRALSQATPDRSQCPWSAPADGAEAHPSDAYFALDRVLGISIVDRWTRIGTLVLGNQTRTLE